MSLKEKEIRGQKELEIRRERPTDEGKLCETEEDRWTATLVTADAASDWDGWKLIESQQKWDGWKVKKFFEISLVGSSTMLGGNQHKNKQKSIVIYLSLAIICPLHKARYYYIINIMVDILWGSQEE